MIILVSKLESFVWSILSLVFFEPWWLIFYGNEVIITSLTNDVRACLGPKANECTQKIIFLVTFWKLEQSFYLNWKYYYCFSYHCFYFCLLVMTSYTDVLKFYEEFGNNDFCILKLSKIQIDVHQSLMNLLNLNYANWYWCHKFVLTAREWDIHILWKHIKISTANGKGCISILSKFLPLSQSKKTTLKKGPRHHCLCLQQKLPSFKCNHTFPHILGYASCMNSSCVVDATSSATALD